MKLSGAASEAILVHAHKSMRMYAHLCQSCQAAQHAAGLRPLSESYCVVITCFVESGSYEVAKAVFDSMTRTGLDPRPGWLALTKACIHKG